MLKLRTLPFPDANNPVEESIRINRNTKSISISAAIVRFRDKDSHQMIMYMPSLEISGYGETKEKALEMFEVSLDSYFDYIIHLSREEQESEMRKLGFKQKKFAHKVFSKSFVDVDGKLHSVNAVEGEVELLSAVA